MHFEKDRPLKKPLVPGQHSDKMISLHQYVDKRLLGLRPDRYSYWNHWRQLSDYLLPRRGRFLITPNQSNRGDPVGGKIIDSTATLGLRTLSAGLMAGLTSPARPWFRLTLRNIDVSKMANVRLWLDEVTSRLLSVMSQSNMYNALHTVYEELGAFGTACILIDEDYEDVIRCQPLTAGEYYLGSSGRNQTDTLYREYVLTAMQVIDRFGIENCSKAVQSLYESKQMDKEIYVAQAIEPNDDRAPQIPGLKGRKYRSVIWELGQHVDTVLDLRGYHELPFASPRWDVMGNDSYGRGPGMDCLGDVKMLQKLTLRLSQAIDKVVNPPMVADVALRNTTTSLLPGGVTYVANSGAVGFKPAYQVPPSIQGALEERKAAQERIKDCLFVNLFLMIAELDDVRTATEIVERKQEKMLMLGPFLERSQFELINPVVDRTFAIMLRGGLLPPPPREVIGAPLDIECVSTLADAQKSTATTGIERLVAFVGNLAAAKQDVLDTINFDEVVDEYAGLLGVTEKVLTTDDERKETRDARAKAMQQAQTAQNGMAAVQGAQTLSQTDVGGGQNALQRMIGTAP